MADECMVCHKPPKDNCKACDVYNIHNGTSFDSFLEEEGILENVNEVARTRIENYNNKDWEHLPELGEYGAYRKHLKGLNEKDEGIVHVNKNWMDTALPSSIIIPKNVKSDDVTAILDEYVSASTNNKPFNSLHEGFAVLLEEVDEVWDIVKLKESKRNRSKLRKEVVQVAAMAMRILNDCT